AAHSAFAQDSIPICPDTIRGTIRTADGKPVPGVKVVATMAPDRLQRTSLTDSVGNYSMVFPDGTGDYFLSASKIGWGPQRKRITRVDQTSLPPWDPVITQIAVNLDEVTVVAKREPLDAGRPAAAVGDNVATLPGLNGALTPEELGNPDAVLAATPGAVQTADGVSVLGLSPDQNNILLNGLAFGGTVPRDARTLIRVFTTAFDPAIGGFSGAQTSIDLAPGFDYSSRRARFTFDDPSLQWGGASDNQLGNIYRQSIMSAGADGPFAGNRFTYSSAAQITHRTSGVPSLLGTTPSAWDALSIRNDAVAELKSSASAIGIPLSGEELRGTQQRISAISRIDHTPYSRRRWGTIVSGEYASADGLGLSPFEAAEQGARETAIQAAAQAFYVTPIKPDGGNELKTGILLSDRRTRPVSSLPEATVLVGASDAGPATFALGGSSAADVRTSAATWQTYDEAQWYATNRQVMKIYVESLLGMNSNRTIAPSSGVFFYDSLSALRANTPTLFARSFDTPHSSDRQWSGTLAASDAWRPIRSFQIQFGARSEVSKFLNVPARNDLLQQTLGVRTDRMPGGAHVSPRVGFKWDYVRPRRNSSQGPLGTRVLSPGGSFHGGIGEFRSVVPAPAALASYALTGVATARRSLICTGMAVPTPDWAGYSMGEAPPSSCVGGGTTPNQGISESNAPNVVAWDPSYEPPRAWRGNLGWTGYLKFLSLTIDGTVTRNLDQRSNLDANFLNAPQFFLTQEQNRPVYAAVSEIDTLTERIAPGAARRSSAFSSVIVRRSDARSTAKQLIVNVTPNWNFAWYFGSVSYALTDVHVVDRGFDQSTFADPTILHAHRSLLPGRQQWHVYAGLNRQWFTMTFFARFYQGERFTPLVDRDINGDGFANDRAYVPTLSAADNAPVDMAQFRTLVASAPSYVRKCLLAQGGRVAAPGDCQAPWRVVTNAQLSFPQLPGKFQRAKVQLDIENPAGLFDLILHGANRLHGWGSPNAIDPTLLRVRSFDATTHSFVYDVNPMFGQTQRTQIATRMPFRVSLGVTLDLGVPYEVQQVGRVLRSIKGAAPSRVSDLVTKEFAAQVPDLYAMILRQSDSLLLSPTQIHALQAADDEYRPRVDSVWAQLDDDILKLPEPYDQGTAYA
ncbi:MAG TPA: carboxypeptidase-like regulatory domain-containing protein, partial [Gemmatimonadaceae bacterium]|nr:carboxypeptidase-like regulatory domain-containing protein [Gemmatimonadaceae bacterium]